MGVEPIFPSTTPQESRARTRLQKKLNFFKREFRLTRLQRKDFHSASSEKKGGLWREEFHFLPHPTDLVLDVSMPFFTWWTDRHLFSIYAICVEVLWIRFVTASLAPPSLLASRVGAQGLLSITFTGKPPRESVWQQNIASGVSISSMRRPEETEPGRSQSHWVVDWDS